MNDTQIVQGVVDALTSKLLYEFKVKVKHVEPVIQPKRSLWDRISRKPVERIQPETERSFKIWPCVAINQYRIAGKALSLPDELFDDDTKTLSLVPEHLPTIIYIIAAAVQNNYLEPDPELITFFERNLDNPDIVQILAASLQAANMQDFSTSIVLMNGMATIVKPKTSPQDGRE